MARSSVKMRVGTQQPVLPATEWAQQVSPGSAILLALGALLFVACGETTTQPGNGEDPPPPGPPVRPRIPEPEVDALEIVCACYKELLEEGVSKDQIMNKTAERAVERGGRLVVLQTERWGTLLPPELYFTVRNRARDKEICEPFVAFLKSNVDEVREHRRQEEAKRAERTRQANEYRAMVNGTQPEPPSDEELMSLPEEDPAAQPAPNH